MRGRQPSERIEESGHRLYKPRGSGAAAGAQPCKEAAWHPRPGRDTES